MARSIIPLLLVFASLLAASTAEALFAQPFEGTRWKVTVTPDDEAHRAGEKEFQDVLVFKGGKFVSEACVKYGFKPVEYHEESSPGGFTASFTAEAASEAEGKTRWHGTKHAAELRGVMTWTKKDGTELNYTFHGERLG